MADLTVTAANVVAGANARIVPGTAGATITAGQLVYLDATDNKFKLADADAAASAVLAGIALNGGANNQPIDVQFGGRINPGATVVVGTIYVASSTAGGIAPVSDLGASDYVSIIGVGVTAALIELQIHNSGVQVPA